MNDKKTAKTSLLVSFILLSISIALWIFEINYFRNLSAAIAALITSGTCIGFAAIGIVKLVNSKISPYKTFAIMETILLLAVIAFAVYDINTSVGFMPGLFGTVLLVTAVPVLIGLLIIDFILWFYKRSKLNK